MINNSLRIVYMGTPGFAVEPLRTLLESKHQIVGVVTATDKPAGRGMNLQPSAVKVFAQEHNLNLLQPESLKSSEFIEQLSALKPDLMVVVAFRMLPKIVWALPRLGTLNLHASLLPQYRGAAPINWAIIKGDTETGITTFFINEEIDTGAIIAQTKVAIPESFSAGDLHDELMLKGAELVRQTVDSIADGTATTKMQDALSTGIELQAAPKLTKENCRIDWNQSAQSVKNHVRGLSPIPAAWTQFCVPNSKALQLKLYSVDTELAVHNHGVGFIVTDNKTYLKVATKDGYVLLKEVQLEGKKRMKIDELLRGFKVQAESSVV